MSRTLQFLSFQQTIDEFFQTLFFLFEIVIDIFHWANISIRYHQSHCTGGHFYIRVLFFQVFKKLAEVVVFFLNHPLFLPRIHFDDVLHENIGLRTGVDFIVIYSYIHFRQILQLASLINQSRKFVHLIFLLMMGTVWLSWKTVFDVVFEILEREVLWTNLAS